MTELCKVPVLSNGEKNDGLFGYTDRAVVTDPSITISGRGTIGFSCVRSKPYFPIVRLITVTPFIGVNLNFLQYTMSALLEQGVGTSIKQLTVPMLAPKLIPLPPLKEQERIVLRIQTLEPFIEDYDKAATELTKLNDSFPEQIKKSILQYAIQGKLVPQNPNDEPASVLLEKIKAEKQKLIKAGKIKKDKVESHIYKRDNRHYEKIGDKEVDITDEIPFEIPDSWRWMRLGNIGEWRAGATPSRQNAKYYNGSISWLKTGDLNDGYITNVEETITELATEQTSAKVRPIGSVLMAMYGATIGKLGILAIPCATNQACCACMPFNGIFNKFLFFYLLAQRRNFIEQGAGGAQPNISREKIIVNLFPLPPLEEQKCIVAKVEEILKLLPSNG